MVLLSKSEQGTVLHVCSKTDDGIVLHSKSEQGTVLHSKSESGMCYIPQVN